MSVDAKRILLVEDSRNDAMLHRRLLMKAGEAVGQHFAVEHAPGLAAAVARLHGDGPAIHVVLLDLGLPDGDGLGSLDQLNRDFPDVPVVILTGLDDLQVGLEAVSVGAQDYLIKGHITPDTLGRALTYAIVRRRLEQALRDSEAEARALFEYNPQPVWVYDVETLGFLEVNPAAQRIYGWSRSELLRMRVTDVRPPEDVPAFVRHLAYRHANPSDQGVWRHRTRDGRDITVRVSAHMLTFRERKACLVLVNDITEIKRMLDALEASEHRFRELFEVSLGLICEHDLDGVLRAVNPAAASALGHRPNEMVGMRLHDLVPAPFRDQVPLYLAAIAANGQFTGVMTLLARDGRWLAWRFNNRLHRDPGRAPYVIGYAQDVTDEVRREQELRDQSLSDALTGCRNRRYLEQLARNGSLHDWGCVVVDLDHFKHINDTYGHQRGDEVLVGVAQFLKSQARRDDAVVRTGGDEFLVLLANEAAAQAPALAQRVTDTAPLEAPCGLSIGLAVRQDGETLDQTLARADAQLYAERRRVRGLPRALP